MSLFDVDFGKLAQTGVEWLTQRPGGNPTAVPKSPIFSSRVTFYLAIPGGENLNIAEFDSMSKSKLIEEKKRFKPYGSLKNISLKKDNGWEITIQGQKTDGVLDYLIYIQEKLLNGSNISSFPSAENSFNGLNVICGNPLFELSEFVKLNDKSMTNYIYKDVSITGYNEDTPEDNGVITYTLNLYSPYRDNTLISMDAKIEKLQTDLGKIITEQIQKNKQ